MVNKIVKQIHINQWKEIKASMITFEANLSELPSTFALYE